MARIDKVHYTPDFKKAYLKLPKYIQRAVDRKDALFRSDPSHPSLRTHKLKGPLKKQWSFYINKSYRVLFEFLSKKSAIFYDVGTHQIYR